MSTRLSPSEFYEELGIFVESIITTEFKNISSISVMKKLYEECSGDPDLYESDIVREIAEELGGEPFDPESDDSEYDEEDDYDY